jgi:hypothetical protein
MTPRQWKWHVVVAVVVACLGYFSPAILELVRVHTWIYVVIVLLASTWFGYYGPLIFVPIPEEEEKRKKAEEQRQKQQKPWRFAECFAQCWLNFVGAATGWAALYFGVSRLPVGATSLGIWDAVAMLVAFLVAFLGITGYLPYAILQAVPQMLRPKAPG